MRRVWIAAILMLICIRAGAAERTRASEPDPIIGTWKGIGMAILFEWTFEADHGIRDALEPNLSGQWARTGTQYDITFNGQKFSGLIDEDGRLILKGENTGMDIPLRKVGAEAAKKVEVPRTAPSGRWLFAYLEKSTLKAGPPFDAITFGGNKARVEFSTVARTYDVNCEIGKGRIELRGNEPPELKQLMSFLPLGYAYQGKVQLTYRWKEDGKTLILSNFLAADPYKCEWAFMRAEDFPPNDVAGRWIGKGSMTGTEMDLRDDGTVRVVRQMGMPLDAEEGEAPAGRPVSFYRLWPSEFGKAISIVRMDREMQLMHVETLRYELRDGEIIVTPIIMEYGEKRVLAAMQAANYRIGGTAGGAKPDAEATTRTVNVPSDAEIAGEWSGTAGAMQIGFSFNIDGSVVWKVDERNFRQQAPGGLKARYKLSAGPRYIHLDMDRFENEEMEGMKFRGILEVIDKNTMRFEGMPSSGGLRPEEFSIEAVTLKRSGPKPVFSEAELQAAARAKAGPEKPSYAVAELPVRRYELPGGVTLEMIEIPAGSFLMGDPNPENEYQSAAPAHPVTIPRPFEIGKYEVTQAQWKAIMGDWPPAINPDDPMARFAKPARTGEKFPAYLVSWNDCKLFIDALNAHIRKSGQGSGEFRLPSEAEWEYACRAGTTTRFFWGSDEYYDDVDHYAWHGGNSEADGMEYAVHEVGLKFPNPWGLHDMSGNVAEWCEDDFGGNYSRPGRPDDGSPWRKENPREHSTRGHSFDGMARGMASYFRTGQRPDTRNRSTGLRLVRELPEGGRTE